MAEHALAKEAEIKANYETPNWWRYFLWKNPSKLSGIGKVDAIAEDRAKEKRQHQAKPSDSELSLYINASPIGPLYARSVATRLLEASGKILNSAAELSQSAEDIMSPHMTESYSNIMSQVVDLQAAEKVLVQALKVVASLASGDPSNREWLANAGICSLLQYFLARRHQVELASVVQSKQSPDMRTPVELIQQISRILAIISIDIGGCENLLRADLVPFLQNMASSGDCSTSSSAARALLHIESALSSGHLVKFSSLSSLFERAREDSSQRTQVLDTVSQSTKAREHTCERHYKDGVIEKQKIKEISWMGHQMKNNLVLHDGIHLFCPLAKHHELLAQNGTTSPGEWIFSACIVHDALRLTQIIFL